MKKMHDYENSRMEQRLGWYLQAKFGLFIHWGPYSLTGSEASWPIMAPDMSKAMFCVDSDVSENEYINLPAKFNPVDFNADEWVSCAKTAGMRYIVFTTKHHDGFCMFDAPGTDYKITNTPYAKDICQELAVACSKYEMPLGFYYSPPDMHHPGYRDTSKLITSNWTGEPKRKEWSEYLDYMESHIRKLLTDYGKISLLWFDGIASHGKYDPKRFHKLIHELSPDTLINDRLGEGGDFVTPEQFIPKAGIPAKSMLRPEGMNPGGDSFFKSVNALFKLPILKQLIRNQMQKYNGGELELSPVYQTVYPSPEDFQPWETCMTMGTTWAFNPNENNWKNPSSLIQNLVSVAAKGGNYLLNIGPTDKGLFPKAAVERIEYIGKWLKTYGDAVYGSTYTPLPTQDWGRALRKGSNVFLFVFKHPDDGILSISDFPGEVKSASVFNGENLSYRKDGAKLEINLPASATDGDLQVLSLEVQEPLSTWENYTKPAEQGVKPSAYLKKQVFNSWWIITLGNVLIALLVFFKHGSFTVTEAAVDAVISTGIISIIVSWLFIDSAKQKIYMRKIRNKAAAKPCKILPKNKIMKIIIITAVTSFLAGLTVLYIPSALGIEVLSKGSYIIIKSLYSGIAGACSALLAVGSLILETKEW